MVFRHQIIAPFLACLCLFSSFSCSPKPEPSGAVTGSFSVEKMTAQRSDNHLKMTIALEFKNLEVDKDELQSENFSLKAGNDDVPKFVRPFANLAVQQGSKRSAEVTFWLDQTMADKELRLFWKQESMVIKPQKSFPIADLPQGEEKIVSW